MGDVLVIAGPQAAGGDLDRYTKKLRELMLGARGSVDAALYQEGLAIEALAVKYTPVDTGRLRATKYTSPPVREGERSVVELGFGTDYAVPLHERTEVALGEGMHGPRKQVKFRAEGTGAKFLERAVHERMSGFESRLARRAKKLFDEGVFITALDPAMPTSPQDPGEAHSELARAQDAATAENIRRDRAARKARLKEKRKAARKAARARRKAVRADRQWHTAANQKLRKAASREARKAKAAAARQAASLRRSAKRQAKSLDRQFKKAAGKVGRKITSIHRRRGPRKKK